MNSYGETALHIACHKGNIDIIELLLSTDSIVNLINQVNKAGYTPFHLACKFHHTEVIDFLLTLNIVSIDYYSYGIFESQQREYGNIIDPWTEGYLKILNQEINQFTTDHPNTAFDFPSDDKKHPNSERSLLGYYVLRHLIRCGEVNNLSQLANEINIEEHVEQLLNIPSIKILAAANATSKMLPDNYFSLHEDKIFSTQTNELLRLAQENINLDFIATQLYSIPEVAKAAGKNGYYQGRDLAETARNDESAMRSLTPIQEYVLAKIKKYYEETIKLQGGTSAVFESFKKILKEKYILKKKQRTIHLNGGKYLLPFSWGKLQEFFNEHPCTEEQLQVIFEKYYQNIYHTAYRYLLTPEQEPNYWMSEDADYATHNSQGGGWAKGVSANQWLIAYLWVAAKDKAQPPGPEDGSVADRVENFIWQIAYCNRAHNWDSNEIDDLKKDRPTCASGVKSNIFQALLYHPLYKPLDKNMIMRFLGDRIYEHYQGIFFCYEEETLQNIKKVADEGWSDCEANPAIIALVLQDADRRRIKQKFIDEYGENLAALFLPQVNEFLNPQDPNAISNDFLRCYNSANLGTLFNTVWQTYPLRKIISECVGTYMGELDAFLAKNFEKLQDLRLNGVGCIWYLIEKKVETVFLETRGLETLESRLAFWKRWVNIVNDKPLLFSLQQRIDRIIHERENDIPVVMPIEEDAPVPKQLSPRHFSLWS